MAPAIEMAKIRDLRPAPQTDPRKAGMDIVPLLTLSGLLFAKEAGVPIPVPGDLLVVGAGVSTSGRPEALAWLAAILLAGYLGGCVQFLLMRGPMRRPILRFLARVGLDERRLNGLAAPLSRRGARGVALARVTPGVRMPVIAASALSALPFGVFAQGLIAGNTVFVSGHFALGFLVGAPATRIAGLVTSPAVVAVLLGVLAIVGVIGWVALRRRRSAAELVRAGDAAVVERASRVGGAAFVSWADAACPICLSIALADNRVHQPWHNGT